MLHISLTTCSPAPGFTGVWTEPRAQGPPQTRGRQTGTGGRRVPAAAKPARPRTVSAGLRPAAQDAALDRALHRRPPRGNAAPGRRGPGGLGQQPETGGGVSSSAARPGHHGQQRSANLPTAGDHGPAAGTTSGRGHFRRDHFRAGPLPGGATSARHGAARAWQERRGGAGGPYLGRWPGHPVLSERPQPEPSTSSVSVRKKAAWVTRIPD